MKKLLGPLLLVLLVAGCAPFVLVEPKRTTVDGAFSVDPQIAWSRANPEEVTKPGPAQIWTVDGFALDQLALYPGIADGQPLARQPDGQEKLPVFKQDMTASEIMELFEATIARVSQTSLTETSNLRPAQFGGVNGFRFDMTFTLKDEVPRKAIIAGAVKDGKLFMIAFQGPRIYYFDKYAPVAERIIASVQFAQPIKSAAAQ